MRRIGMFGGGHLAQALLAGFVRAGRKEIRVHVRSREKLEALAAAYPVEAVGVIEDLPVDGSMVLVLVPPKIALDLPDDFVEAVRGSGSILVSCAGGVGYARLVARCPGVRVARALPAITARVGHGTTLVQGAPDVLAEIAPVFADLGPVHALATDADFDRVGTLTSCGPGLIAALVDALGDAFDADGAERRLLWDTVLGTALDLTQRGVTARALVGEVVTPGGPTEAGVRAIDDAMPGAFARMRRDVEAARSRRSRSL